MTTEATIVGHDICPFCAIVAGHAPATIRYEWPIALGIVPLNPVTDGHLLVIPKVHVRSAMEAGRGLLGAVMECAGDLASRMGRSCNLITSCGWEATQTVHHLHIHYVPRRDGDGLHLPWTGQTAMEAQP